MSAGRRQGGVTRACVCPIGYLNRSIIWQRPCRREPSRLRIPGDMYRVGQHLLGTPHLQVDRHGTADSDLTYIRPIPYAHRMSLRYSILGFLSVHPLSGYDLKRAFDESVGHFWTADQAQIYRTLERLIEDGLVEADHIEQLGRPARNEHRLTAVGRDELDTWLVCPHEPQPPRESFLLKVFFAGRLGREPVRHIILERIEAASERLAVLRGIAGSVETELADTRIGLEQRLRLATLDNGIRHAQAEIDWATALLEVIDKENP